MSDWLVLTASLPTSPSALRVRGLQAQHANDNELLTAACAFLDTLYAALRLSK